VAVDDVEAGRDQEPDGDPGECGTTETFREKVGEYDRPGPQDCNDQAWDVAVRSQEEEARREQEVPRRADVGLLVHQRPPASQDVECHPDVDGLVRKPGDVHEVREPNGECDAEDRRRNDQRDGPAQPRDLIAQAFGRPVGGPRVGLTTANGNWV